MASGPGQKPGWRTDHLRSGRCHHHKCGSDPSTTVVAQRAQTERATSVPDDRASEGPGAMLLVTRCHTEGIAARFLCRAEFIDFQGARDARIGDRLAAALIRDRGAPVKSLRQDVHIEDETCWLH